MIRRSITLVVAALAALAAASQALAGGWAVVTLDEVPQAPRAGETIELGFMVRQHGRTPVDVHTFEGELPTLWARHGTSGETVTATARKQGAVGHYVVSVTFPRDGTWAWEIIPAPFAGTRFEPLTVLPAASGRRLALGAAARPALVGVGLALLLAASLLALRSRRGERGAGALRPAHE